VLLALIVGAPSIALGLGLRFGKGFSRVSALLALAVAVVVVVTHGPDLAGVIAYIAAFVAMLVAAGFVGPAASERALPAALLSFVVTLATCLVAGWLFGWS
jgi:hypothetical protein